MFQALEGCSRFRRDAPGSTGMFQALQGSPCQCLATSQAPSACPEPLSWVQDAAFWGEVIPAPLW